MWSHVSDGAPIGAITNGVDHRVWQDARVRDAATPQALDEAHLECKTEMLRAVTARTGCILDPHKLTIGFARRATAYKRATLLFHDWPRAAKLLDEGKVQLVFAGKNHPRDAGGRALVAELVHLSRRFPGKVVFVPDYDLELGRILTRGCDIWLNTPRRPLEACGTSGMKAAMNGVLNVSILDGWWVEGCADGVTGWRIGDERSYATEAEGDAADAAALHDLLEKTVVPTFYDDRARWLNMMRASINMAVTRFSADRMVRDYYEQLYIPQPLRQRVAIG
jgi:starch phosphorylase